MPWPRLGPQNLQIQYYVSRSRGPAEPDLFLCTCFLAMRYKPARTQGRNLGELSHGSCTPHLGIGILNSRVSTCGYTRAQYTPVQRDLSAVSAVPIAGQDGFLPIPHMFPSQTSQITITLIISACPCHGNLTPRWLMHVP